jgi:hypothetical protein
LEAELFMFDGKTGKRGIEEVLYRLQRRGFRQAGRKALAYHVNRAAETASLIPSR